VNVIVLGVGMGVDVEGKEIHIRQHRTQAAKE